VISNLNGHKKKINDIAFFPNSTDNAILVCSEDGKGSVFDSKAMKGKIVYKVDCHSDSLTGCDIHPMGNLFAVSSLDSQFSFHDLNAEKKIRNSTIKR